MSFIRADSNFHKLILALGGERYSHFIQAYFSWQRIVGDLLAERSHPIKLDNDILYVGVQNSTWMQELVLRKADIISKYAAYGENINDIIYLINSPKRRKK